MNRTNRTQLALGLMLVLLGGWFFAVQNNPTLKNLMDQYLHGPMVMVALGGALLIFGLIVGAPGMAVPACILAGIGGILVYQSQTSDYSSWRYMWTLIPGFVGVGNILSGLLGAHFRMGLRNGFNLIVVSGVLFLIFASSLGGPDIFGKYGPPILLMGLGAWIIVRGLTRARSS